jgi:hypothetical protein
MITKTNLIGKVNAKYEIIKQGDIAVIGKKDMGEYGTQYVAWHYKENSDGTVDYFWGRYGSQEYAEECFDKKEHGIYSGD